MSRFPIHDNHLHLTANGYRKQALRKFQQAGGTSLCIITTYKSYKDADTLEKYFDMASYYDQTYKYSLNAKEMGIKTQLALGPHPNMITKYYNYSKSFEKTESYIKNNIDSALEYINKGKAQCLGEIGWPDDLFKNKDQQIMHSIETIDKLMTIAQNVMEYSFENCQENQTPIMLHTPTNMIYYQKSQELACKYNIPEYKIMKHFSKPLFDKEQTKGITPSIILHQSVIKKLIRRTEALPKENYLFETDYMDLKEDPNIVCPIDSVPRTVLNLYQQELLTENDIYYIGQDLVDKIYNCN